MKFSWGTGVTLTMMAFIALMAGFMVKAIQEVAKENGYAHVLYKEYALVFPEADDLADRVKKKLGVK